MGRARARFFSFHLIGMPDQVRHDGEMLNQVQHDGARHDGMKFVGFVEGRLGVRLLVNFGKLWRLSDIFT